MARKVICQFCRQKDDKENMIKFHDKYYHTNCKKLIDDREKAIDLFYTYTHSLCLKKELYNVFSIIKKQQHLNESDILYVMEYIVRNKCKLNFPMGIRYYVDKAMKDKTIKEKLEIQKQKELENLQNEIIDTEVINKKYKKEESDISDIIDI